ncbi:MAG: nitroreductase family protein [Acidimicrobiia bacterium]|nr:nitroreductase family protein [Acidimicrobiia bacterium]
MDFDDVLRHRRMVRNFTDEPVDRAVVDRILDAARRAPSAGNSQGQAFVVVTDPERRRHIAQLADEHTYVGMGFDPWISKAPVHVVVCVSEELYRARYREPDKSPDGTEHEWPVPYWWVDAGAALMLVLLAAVSEGLAAGFLGSHAMPELETFLDLPDHVRAVGVVTIGHPAPDRRSGSLARGRRPLSDVVHEERWTTGE